MEDLNYENKELKMAKEVEFLVTNKNMSVENALDIVKNKYKKATKNSDQSVPSSIQKQSLIV